MGTHGELVQQGRQSEALHVAFLAPGVFHILKAYISDRTTEFLASPWLEELLTEIHGDCPSFWEPES